MSYVTVGSCPRCGSPIYAQNPWWGILPPPSIPSCTCFPQGHGTTTNTVTVAAPSAEPQGEAP